VTIPPLVKLLEQIAIYLALLIYFTNVPAYLYLLGFSSIPPAAYVLLICASVGIIVALNSGYGSVNLPVLIWVLAFIIVTAAWGIVSSGSADAQVLLLQRIGGSVGLITLIILFGRDAFAVRHTRKVMIWLLMAAVLMNIIDYLSYGLFIPQSSEFFNAGRAAGFYVNANAAGIAILVGMLFTTTLINHKWRPWLVLYCGLGVVLTLSRGAILAWVCLLLFFVLRRMIRITRLIGACAVGVIAGFIFLTLFGLDTSNYNEGYIEARLEWILKPRDFEFSQQERLWVARVAFEQFAGNVFFGNGIGTTVEKVGVPPHNGYLEYAADYGLVGLLVIPALAFLLWTPTSAAGRRPETLVVRYGFVFLLLFQAMFTHSVISNNVLVLGVALLASKYFGTNELEENNI